MSYLTIAIPQSQASVAQTISMALDPDVGGEFAFNRTATDSTGAVWAVYGTTMDPTFLADTVTPLLSNATALQATVAKEIAGRFATKNVAVPTLAQVQSFLSTVKTSTVYGIGAGLAEMKLTLVVPTKI